MLTLSATAELALQMLGKIPTKTLLLVAVLASTKIRRPPESKLP